MMGSKESPQASQDNAARPTRWGVLLALAAQRRAPPPTVHPSAEDLAAFSEGRLGSQDRERILAHLDACPDCYCEWLAVGDVLLHPDRQPVSQRGRRWLANLLRPGWNAFAWSGIGVALAACLALFSLGWPWRPETGLSGLVERAYDTASTMPASRIQEVAAALELPWEGPALVYGFSTTAKEEAARAFAAGLWAGRAVLSSGNRQPPARLPALLSPAQTDPAKARAWADTAWADYALLGRWIVLLQTTCRANVDNPAFWVEQRSVADAVRKQFERHREATDSTPPVLGVLQHLHAALHAPALAARHDRLCQRVEYETARLLALLTPR